jgi:hypothetical protein
MKAATKMKKVPELFSAKDLRTLILAISKVSIPNNSDLPMGPPSSSTEVRDGQRYTRTVQGRKASNSFESTVAFVVHASVLWPGATIQGVSLSSGVLSPIPLSRAPGVMVLTNVMLGGTQPPSYSKALKQPSLDSAETARQELIRQKLPQDSAAKISFSMNQFYSLDHAMLQIGASVEWLSGSARAQLDSSKFSEQNNFIVSFVQAYYTVAWETPASPEAVFKSNVHMEDAKLYIGPGNPPVYVDSVTYGRMLIFTVSSKTESSELKASLNAAFNSYSVSGSISLSADQKRVLQESEVKVLGLGGPASGVVDLITSPDKAQALQAYLRSGQNFSQASPGVPISYQARYLRDFGIAKVAFTTDYNVETWTPNPLKVQALKVSLHTHNDDKDDSASEHIEIYFGSSLIASGDYGWKQKWESNVTVEYWMKLDPNVTVASDKVRDMSILIRQDLDNTGWDMSYDVYAQFDDGITRRITHGRERRLGDDQPNAFQEAFTGS